MAVCPPKRCDYLPTQGALLSVHPRGVAVCPLKRWGCVPTQEGWLRATNEVWLCAHPRGLAVSTPRSVVGCLQRCVIVRPQSCGCGPIKRCGSVSTKERWLDVVAWQCATQGITLRIAFVAL